MKRTWSDASIARLRAQYPARPNTELAAEFGVSVNALVMAAQRYGVTKDDAYIAKLNRGNGRKPSMRHAFLSQCADLFDRPTGASRPECVARTGLAVTNAHGFLWKAKRAGELYPAGKLAQMRYFLTAEAAKAGAVLMEAEGAQRRAQTLERKRAKQRSAYTPRPKVAKVKAVKPPQAPKVKPPKQPKPMKRIKFAAPKPKPIRRAELPVVIPDHVQVQRLPGYTGAPKWAINGRTWGDTAKRSGQEAA